jgi:hypothetical protein
MDSAPSGIGAGNEKYPVDLTNGIWYGLNTKATGNSTDIKIGNNALTGGSNNKISIGSGSLATGGHGAIAIGQSSIANGHNVLVVGTGAIGGTQCTVFGGGATTYLSSGSVAVGLDAAANPNFSTSVGGTSVANNNACAFGQWATATGSGSLAIGRLSIASASSSVAIGRNSIASASSSVAIGTSITANQTGGIFIQHRTGAFTANPAGFMAGTNELVELTSSRRFKDVTGNLEEVSDRIDALNPVRYVTKPGQIGDDREHIGLIAEELHEQFPEFVTYDNTDEKLPKGINYGDLVTVLIKELQTLRKRVAVLEAK